MTSVANRDPFTPPPICGACREPMTLAGVRVDADARLKVYRCERCGDDAVVGAEPRPRDLHDELAKTSKALADFALDVCEGRSSFDSLRARDLATQIDDVLRRMGR